MFTWIVWVGFFTDFAFDYVVILAVHADAYLSALSSALFTVTFLIRFTFDIYIRNNSLLAGITIFNLPLNHLLFSPLVDMDYAYATDCEDLVAFAYDIFEFLEQDKSMLVDYITNYLKSVSSTTWALLASLTFSFFKRK